MSLCIYGKNVDEKVPVWFYSTWNLNYATIYVLKIVSVIEH